MPLNYTPLSWKTVDPSDPKQMKLFLLQLSDLLLNAFNPAFLSSALNGNALIQGSAIASGTITGSNIASNTVTVGNLKPVVSVNVSQVGNLSVACDNATSVFAFISWTASTSTALTLTHLGFGVPVTVQFVNAFSAPQGYSINATDPAGNAYSEVLTTFATSTAGVAATDNTIGVNLTNGTRITYSGMSGGITGTGRLYFVA